MSMTRDPGLSEELLSDVFYAAVLRLQSFRGGSPTMNMKTGFRAV